MRTGPVTIIAAAATGLILVCDATAATAARPNDRAAVVAVQRGPQAGAPPGWTVTSTATGRRITWHAPRELPVGDARIEFFAGDRRLGVPRASADGRSLHLDIADGSVLAAAMLQVRSGGVRLDGPGPAARAPGGQPTQGATPHRPAQLPPADVDPGTPGGYETVSGEYALAPVRLPGLAEPVEQQALVVAPQGAPGPLPMVVFLHGRHAVCFHPARGVGRVTWPCPAPYRPIPSHQGYRASQELLASQGYLTVSISANGINGQDAPLPDDGAQARSSLIRLHLAQWARWAGAERGQAPEIVRDVAGADTSRVLLVGHSRGGEGVNRAAIDSAYPSPAQADGYRGPVSWRIRGLLLLAPTALGQNPAPDVPSVALLPGCDGDVRDLQGQLYVDASRAVGTDTAMHSAALVVGADHNFFNSEWTPNMGSTPAVDDWSFRDDPVCGNGPGALRLTPLQQQAVGATYVAAAARLFLQDDERVRPLLDGTGLRAPSADPAVVYTHAVGAGHSPVLLPSPQLRVTGSGSTSARVCAHVDPDASVACTSGGTPAAPHFVRFQDVSAEAGRHAVRLDWSGPDSPATVAPAAPVRLAGAQSLALRIAVPPNTTGTRIDVAVTDTGGTRAVLGQAMLDGLPGSPRTTDLWAREVRLPLTAAVQAGVDLGQIAAVQLIPRTGSGQAWLIDAWAWRSATAPAPMSAVARVDLGEAQEQEGDTGPRTYRLPVAVSGQGNGELRLFVTDTATGEQTQQVLAVPAGATHLDLPIAGQADSRPGPDRRYRVLAKAGQRTVVGDYEGAVTVLDDDANEPRAAPGVEAAMTSDHVVPGGFRRADVPRRRISNRCCSAQRSAGR